MCPWRSGEIESFKFFDCIFRDVFIGIERVDMIEYMAFLFGDLAQLVRASRLHREGRGSESLSPHQNSKSKRRSAASLFFVFRGWGARKTRKIGGRFAKH